MQSIQLVQLTPTPSLKSQHPYNPSSSRPQGEHSMKRRKLTRKQSNKSFRKGAGHHKKNTAQRPMRGGWRL